MARLNRLSLVLLFALAMSTTIAPVGLCACWLNPDLETVHPHLFGQAGVPHSHEYLLQISSATMADALPVSVVLAAVLVALMGLASLWWAMDSPAVDQIFNQTRPPIPPPRSI